jgi:hypothetical protein
MTNNLDKICKKWYLIILDTPILTPFPVTYARRQCGGYCLAKGMKVSFIVTQGDKARSPQYVSPYLGLRKKAGD